MFRRNHITCETQMFRCQEDAEMKMRPLDKRTLDCDDFFPRVDVTERKFNYKATWQSARWLCTENRREFPMKNSNCHRQEFFRWVFVLNIFCMLKLIKFWLVVHLSETIWWASDSGCGFTLCTIWIARCDTNLVKKCFSLIVETL